MNLLIIYTGNGYDLILSDGTPMEFVDKSQTNGISDLKEAFAQCNRHDYEYVGQDEMGNYIFRPRENIEL